MRGPEETLRDLVQQWLRHAEEDLLVAQELMERDRLSYNPVGFHAQQAAEKFLKALLTRHRLAFPKTHSIRILLELALPVLPDLYDRLQHAHTLTPYGVEIRYPRGGLSLSREEGAEAVQLASDVRSEVLSRLDEYLRGGRV
jgi:HEPN domain-containing protein